MLGEQDFSGRTVQRVPPNSDRLERIVLGNMLLDADCLRLGLEMLAQADFYAPIRGEVFAAIAAVSKAGKGVDTALVLEALKARSGRHELAWDEIEACSAQPLTPDLEQHCGALRRMSSARALIRACFKIAAEGCEPIEDFDSYLDRSAAAFGEAMRSRLDEVEIENIGDVAARAYDEMGARILAPKSLLGQTTGLYDLDKLLGGLRPGAVYVIASRPGLGKSTLGLQFSEQFARRGKRVAFFSLEMAAEELALRAISASSGVDSRTLSTGDGLAARMTEVAGAVNALQIPIRLPKARRVTIDVITRVARREHMQHDGLGCIVVDYLQLVAASGKYKNREQEVAEISRGLKLLALELGVPVVAMAQLNRSVESRNGKPILSDLRESGAIEQDADVVMFLHRTDAEQEQERSEIDCDIVVAKHRGGPVGSVQVIFQRSVTRYVNRCAR
jgi:replicative DNA helicase